MKKTYINPETSIVLLNMQRMIAASNPTGFNGELNNDNPITPDVMLSREKRRSVWDDEMEEDELSY